MITWNREVSSPLTDLNKERNLITIYLNTFKSFLTTEVNKVYGCDMSINKSRSERCFTSKIIPVKDTLELIKSQSNDVDLSTRTFDLYNNQILSLGLGSPQLTDNKTSILDDIYTFDFQARYFLEQ